jgi:RHS repeat-associated protein
MRLEKSTFFFDTDYEKEDSRTFFGVNYQSFGSPMTGRTFSSEKYRFGFNGKENDNEVKGVGNQIDFGARIYDPRLGRFLSIDPDHKKFPYWTPYLYAGNTPTLYVDIDGKGPGTRFIFFEGSIGIGVGAAALYIEQSGIAYDRAGKTHFTIATKLNVSNQGLDKSNELPDLYVGLEASLSAGFKYDKRSSFVATTKGNALSSGVDLPKARGKLGVGGEVSANSIGVSLGLSVGAGVLFAEDNVQFSVSLSDREAEITSDATDVWTESWTVNNSSPILDKSGSITGYQGTVGTIDSKGNKVDTGIKVFSGVSKDIKGNTSSNNMWLSNDYKVEADKAAKEENK